MERYELVEGTSSKFWEVRVDDTTLTVCFGRIGTNGQTKEKAFASAAAATAEMAKVVREKTSKGYKLVGAGVGGGSAQAAGQPHVNIPSARSPHPIPPPQAGEGANTAVPANLRVMSAEVAESFAMPERMPATEAVTLAGTEALPAVLRDPPWRKKAGASKGVVLALAPLATSFSYTGSSESRIPGEFRKKAKLLASMDELPGFIKDCEANTRNDYLYRLIKPHAPIPEGSDAENTLLPWLERRWSDILQGHDGLPGVHWDPITYEIEKQPEVLSLWLWDHAHMHWLWMRQFTSWEVFRAMFARFGERALPGFIRQLKDDPDTIYDQALEVDARDLVPIAVHAAITVKKPHEGARNWLKRYPRTAITVLLPDAVGKLGQKREVAEKALHWIVANVADGRGLVDQVAAAYEPQDARVTDAVRQVLERDGLSQVPASIGKLPAWFKPATLTRPVLRHGGTLPDTAVGALAEMLSFSTAENAYAGIAVVKQACTGDSLAAFAWDLFSAWLDEGAPAKDAWALRAVGWLGDDDCARRLTALIRKWPGEAAHARAVTGLDALADIGTDVALMHLNGIAEKVKFKGIQERAREKIAALAAARGLTPEELSDRLAPDLDLDARGGLDLDFGGRRFRVGFDEFLKPWVKDAAGQRLNDLPKPNKSDDPERSAAAAARWKSLKADARLVASVQIVRLENMLSQARRVAPDIFRQFFAAHPLIRHLTQRLVWGLYADDAPGRAPEVIFRVAEDLSLTDAQDNALDLDLSDGAAGRIGLVHSLHLPDGGWDAWGALFGDYEIVQPFAQLGREVYTLTEPERDAKVVTRFDGIQVESPRVRGMNGKGGWRLGQPQDAGAIWELERPVRLKDGRKARAVLEFVDGLNVAGPEFEDERQTLGKLVLRAEQSSGRNAGHHAFGELDPVTFSETVRGIALLAEPR